MVTNNPFKDLNTFHVLDYYQKVGLDRQVTMNNMFEDVKVGKNELEVNVIICKWQIVCM